MNPTIRYAALATLLLLLAVQPGLSAPDTSPEEPAETPKAEPTPKADPTPKVEPPEKKAEPKPRPMPLIFQEDEILGVVNDECVTYGELMPEVDEAEENWRKSLPRPPSDRQALKARIRFFQNAFERRVDQILWRDLANESGVTIDKARLRDILAQDVAAAGGEDVLIRERFPERLGRQVDVTFQDYAADREQKLKIEKVQRQRLGRARFITPKELAAYYKEHKARYREEAKVKLRRVLIQYKPDEKLAALAEMQAWRAGVVEKPETFELIAKAHSLGKHGKNGGLMKPRDDAEPWFKSGQLREPMAAAAFSLEPGQVSAVLEADLMDGDDLQELMFLRVEEKQAARQKSFLEVQGVVRIEIWTLEQEAKRRRLVQELRKKAYIDSFVLQIQHGSP